MSKPWLNGPASDKPVGVSRRRPSLSPARRAALLGSALLLCLPQGPAQQPAAPAAPDAAVASEPLDPLLATALLHKARGREAEAVLPLLQYAERLAAQAEAPVADRIAAEGAVAMALGLLYRSTAAPELQDRALALRTSPLGRADAAFADQVGTLTLERRAAGGDDRTGTLARDLGFIDDWWICGPFDNERGSALARELPPEPGFDATTTWPGKLRPVGWRRLTGMAPSGRLWLAAALRPADQTACLVTTTLVAARVTTAALHLGCAGSYLVRLGGREIARRDVDRPFALEQDAVALPLQAGPNLLTVKFCHQETGEFAVALRLAAPDGGRAAGVEVAADVATMQSAAARVATAAPAGTPTAPTVRQGARSLRAIGDAHGIEAMWLGALWYLRSADGEVDRRDRAFATTAVADLPALPQARLLLAATRVRNARVAAEVDDNARRNDYEAILALDPEHVEAAVHLGGMLLQGLGLRDEAERLARSALRVCPGHESAHQLLAEVLRADNQTGLARREVLAAAANPNAGAAALRSASRWLGDGANAELEGIYDRLQRTSGAVGDQLAGIDLLLRRGRIEPALAAIAHLQQLEPLTRRCFELRADLAEARLDFAAALQEYDAWLLLCPDDDDALAAQSRLHGRLGHRDQQIESLRAAIECNPNRRDDQRYLEYLAAETTPFHTAWQIDATPLLGEPTPAAATAAKDPVYHLLRQRVVLAHRNGTTSEYLHHCVRILSDAGARSWSNFRLPFYYGEQRARLLACTVHKADGSAEQPRLRGAAVALPSLQPGDTVDLEGRIDDTAPTFFGDYFGLQHFFGAADGAAVHRSDLVVIAEPGRDYRYQRRGGAPAPVEATTAGGNRTFAFRLDDVARDVPEPNRPDPKERAPLVRFTTFRDWDHFAGWWWNLIRGQIETTAAMRATVRTLTADCTSVPQKIRAIYRFVTTDVRYEAWEFGVHGYKPYSTAVIYERRHGDCKDKALLLCALLGEIGVHADPVLILADGRRSQDDLELPMVQHFNHCIAWMPEQDGRPAQFLDGTAIWHPDTTIPDMDQGAEVLVVDRGKALLRQVPWVDPLQNTDRVAFALELQPDGSVRASQVETPTGNEAVPLRQALAVEPARRREHVERNLVPLFGQVTIGQLECSDPLQYDLPLQLTVDFTVPTLGQRTAHEWQLPSAFGAEPWTELAAEAERNSPLLLGVPRQDVRTIHYRLPAGYGPGQLPAAVGQETPFGAFHVDWRRQGDQIVVERTVVLTSPRIEATDYPTFRDFVAALRAADAQRVLLQREDGR